MDAADLAIFAAAAKAGGITRAAETLHTVQSNVTQRIRRLEAELGVPLFNRHSRGVTLTSAGTQLLPYAERIGQLLGEAKRAAADGSTARGRIAIGALESATAVRLPPVLAAYGAACPEVDIEIDTGTTASLVDAVLERRLEAAFVAGVVSHQELLAIPVIQEELVVVTAPWIARLDALAEPAGGGPLKLIVFRSGCSYRTRLEALLAERGVVNPRRLEFGTLDGIIGCVGAGIGVTLLPRVVVARAARDGRVALHRLPSQEARIDTVLIRRRDSFLSTALARFIEIVREQLGKVPATRSRRRR
ncbi:MAG TPA: LysR substrate-binding domain-containing protein [Stellaceae bacterium]|nr:LysR substrate-binding domain-containing protein [Stellaceae bacterium]